MICASSDLPGCFRVLIFTFIIAALAFFASASTIVHAFFIFKAEGSFVMILTEAAINLLELPPTD